MRNHQIRKTHTKSTTIPPKNENDVIFSFIELDFASTRLFIQLNHCFLLFSYNCHFHTFRSLLWLLVLFFVYLDIRVLCNFLVFQHYIQTCIFLGRRFGFLNVFSISIQNSYSKFSYFYIFLHFFISTKFHYNPFFFWPLHLWKFFLSFIVPVLCQNLFMLLQLFLSFFFPSYRFNIS